jgi:hypothetical protein
MKDDSDADQFPVLTDVLVPGVMEAGLQQKLISRTQELLAERLETTVQHVLNRHMLLLHESLKESLEQLTSEVLAEAIAEQTALARLQSTRRQP